MKRALLVHNDNAGTDPVPRHVIEAYLRRAGYESRYCSHLDEELEAALEGPFDLIVAAGGDGTVADVVSALKDQDVPIGILPLGGANNIAGALGVDGDWRTIPERWSAERWTLLDRCEADGPWGRRRFVEAVGTGVLTDAVDDAEEAPRTAAEKRENGRAAFRAALCRAEPFDCAIETPDRRWQGQCLMVEMLNIPFVGSTLALAPGALAGDGLFDIVVVQPHQRDLLHEWALDPDSAPCPLPVWRATRARLTVHDRPFRLDDRSPDATLSGSVEVRLRRPVKILQPRELT